VVSTVLITSCSGFADGIAGIYSSH
jgi:hypothetical protein